MKIRIITVALISMMFLAISCEDEANPTYVWGELGASVFSTVDDINGTLAYSGADYYGTCKADSSGFSFSVANVRPSSSSDSSDYYLSVSGITGTPTSGVYAGGEPKNDDALLRPFSSAVVQSAGTKWTIGQSDIEGAGNNCKVRLYAEAKDDELTDSKYGEPEFFDYYVWVSCSDVDIDSSSQSLTGFSARLFFRNCG